MNASRAIVVLTVVALIGSAVASPVAAAVTTDGTVASSAAGVVG